MTEEPATLYCYVHPNRETSLRCNRCERPICTECAVHTPTGYRCRECVREQQRIFNTAEWYDYLIGFGTTAVLSLIASIIISLISSFIGFFFMLFVSFMIAGAAGVIIANVTQAALRRRRSKQLFWLTAAGVVAGAIPIILFLLFTGGLFSIIWQGIYLFTATPTVYARISGFQFSR
jgi:hypothetical protein